MSTPASPRTPPVKYLVSSLLHPSQIPPSAQSSPATFITNAPYGTHLHLHTRKPASICLSRFAKANPLLFYKNARMNKFSRSLHSCATRSMVLKNSPRVEQMTIESAIQQPRHPNSKILRPLKWSLLAGGTALAVYGAARKSPWSIGIGAATGLAGAIGPRTNGASHGVHFNRSFAINCSPERA